MFDRIPAPAPDPILTINAAFKADDRTHKIDLGIGVFKDTDGQTPIFAAIKAAERHLVETQTTKTYVSPVGDLDFVSRVGDLVLPGRKLHSDYAGAQAVGGTGAVMLAFQMAKRAGAQRIWIPHPTWGNHRGIAAAIGLEQERYHHSATTIGVSGDMALKDLAGAQPGDAIVLHGCCQNPTGIDYTPAEQAALIDLIAAKGLLAIVDTAYLGFGESFEADAAFMRAIVDRMPETLVAISFSKNMGLYRDRLGVCFAVTNTASQLKTLQASLVSIARTAYSMPPDHAASAVKIILESPKLSEDWMTELNAQRTYIKSNRADFAAALANKGFNSDYIRDGNGMFCLLPLTPDAMDTLRDDSAVYLGPGGRTNIAALAKKDMAFLADAITPFLAPK